MDLKENYNHLKAEAYAGLQKRQSSKKWIKMLEVFPYYLGDMNRGRLLQSVNIAMRILDDLADGDRKTPLGTTPVQYLEAKQLFVLNPTIQPTDEIDQMFKYCYALADKCGLLIQNELNAFFKYFIFDAKRFGTGQVFTQAELDHAYDSCDIEGTIRGSLMVFGENPDRAEKLMPLGKATRIFYTLRDYDADIKAGFVNIPKEAMDRYSISEVDLKNKNSVPVRTWFEAEAVKALTLIALQDQILQSEKFGFRGRLALNAAYKNPAVNFLERMLAGKTNQS